MASTLFSDSWHLVAEQKLALRPEARARRQRYGGQLWYVIEDPYAHRFYRVSPDAYRFIERLDRRRTVEAIWLELVSDFPEAAPGQQEALQTLTQLFRAGLLHSDQPLESERFFQAVEVERTQTARMRWLQFLFVRIPLWDPDRFLNAFRSVIGWVIGPVGAIGLLLVVLIGGGHVVGRTELLANESEGILSAGNILWLYLTWVFVKFFHELGHAAVCKRFGGEVHVMGVMLLVFTPFPYVDATGSWAFRERWKRVLTGSAGMLFELSLAGIAAIVWARTSPGVIHQVAYNVMFLASVSTVLFNLNPLLRFDGYYILSDLLDSPNLHPRSHRQLVSLLERRLFGLREEEARPAAHSPREAFWLPTFALASGAYRIFILGVILLFLAQRFLGLGMVLAVVGLVLWVLVPLVRLGNYLLSSPRLARRRGRAMGVVGGLVGVVLLLLFVLPFPRHFRAPGVVESDPFQMVLTEVEGTVSRVFQVSGEAVKRGDLLVQLENPDLRLEQRRVEASIEEMEARRTLARERQPAAIAALDERLDSLRRRKTTLAARLDALEIRAPMDGIWSAPMLAQAGGVLLPRGAILGQIVRQETFRFVAVTSQEDASNLFGAEIRASSVRLRGEAEWALEGSDLRIAPAESRELPTASLGWMAGGSVQVRADDEAGLTTVEPWFEVSVRLPPDAQALPLHLRSGVARFTLAPEPLGWQWVRRARQLFQRRLGI